MATSEPANWGVGEVNPWRDEATLRWAYWEKGFSTREVGELFGVSKKTVIRWMEKHGIERQSRAEANREATPSTLKDPEELARAYRKCGRSQYKLAEELGVSDTTVSNWMRRHGIEVYGPRGLDPQYERLHDPQWLEQKYIQEEMSVVKIAGVLGCTPRHVSHCLHQHGIGVGVEARYPKLLDREWMGEQYNQEGRTCKEIADELGTSRDTVREYLIEHGFDTSHSGFPSGEDHPQWQGGWEKYYGPNWYSQRKATLRRDQYRCQDCGLTQPEHKNRHNGEGLHVHHITPTRKFDDYEQQNALDNLVVLCRVCHRRWEGIPVRPQ